MDGHGVVAPKSNLLEISMSSSTVANGTSMPETRLFGIRTAIASKQDTLQTLMAVSLSATLKEDLAMLSQLLAALENQHVKIPANAGSASLASIRTTTQSSTPISLPTPS